MWGVSGSVSGKCPQVSLGRNPSIRPIQPIHISRKCRHCNSLPGRVPSQTRCRGGPYLRHHAHGLSQKRATKKLKQRRKRKEKIEEKRKQRKRHYTFNRDFATNKREKKRTSWHFDAICALAFLYSEERKRATDWNMFKCSVCLITD